VGDRLGTPGRVVSHVVALPFAAPEAIGLGGDVAIDWIKGHTVTHESICDEGKRGYINPFHQWLPGPLKGPQMKLPRFPGLGRCSGSDHAALVTADVVCWCSNALGESNPRLVCRRAGL
jgi:hypothetical protein